MRVLVVGDSYMPASVSATAFARLGDAVALVPGYSPSTVNWYDAYHVVRDEVVVDIWPIIPRGPGHHGLADRAR